jgi:threonine dehydrogenase-like Zn-dependent dehydrogenase
MVQLARLSGASAVILLEPVAGKREQGLKVGADIAIDPTHEDIEAVLLAKGIRQIDRVIECVGHKATMLNALKYAGRNSVVMLFGLGNPSDEIPIRPFEIFKKEIQIKASYINPYTQERAISLINSGKIDLMTLIGKTIPLDELGSTLADPSRRKSGKVIVLPGK